MIFSILYSLTCRIELKKWDVELNIEYRLGYRTKFRIVCVKDITSNTPRSLNQTLIYYLHYMIKAKAAPMTVEINMPGVK